MDHRKWTHVDLDQTALGPGGRLNLITAERRLSAVAEVKEGRAFCLSLPLDLPGGNGLVQQRHPPVRGIEDMPGGHKFVNFPMAAENPRWDDISSDDYVTLYTQYSTQWDALCHTGRHIDVVGDGKPEPVYYNGYRAGSDIIGPDAPGGAAAKKLGIENMATSCVQGRGVLIDLNAAFGSARVLVGYDELARIMEADQVAVETGDMLCLHTGYGQAMLDMGGNPDPKTLHSTYPVLNGRDDRLLDWIETSGISVLIADNFAVEGFPYPDPPGTHTFHGLPLHQKTLVDLGIHLGELWYLTELAAYLRKTKRSRFLLTAPPLRLPGSMGSPVTPVATV